MIRSIENITRIWFVWLVVFAINAVAGGQKTVAQGSARAARYAENSVLRQGTWVKIRVAESGVYKLTYEQLAEMGITPD